MKASFKTMVALFALTAATFTLASCGGSGQSPSAGEASQSQASAEAPSASGTPADGIDISENVTVEWYILGAPDPDWDAMMAEFNKLTNEVLNCNVNVTWIDFGNFLTQYPLLLASGENVDLCFQAVWMNFQSEAAKGAFYPIEDIAPIYAPTAYGWLPEEGIKNLSVNGRLYGLTGDNINRELMGYIVRGDLMKKYGIETIDSYKDLENFMQAVVDNDPQIIPLDQGGDGGLFIQMPQNLGLFSVAMYNFPLVVNLESEKEGEIVNLYEFPGTLEYFEMMRDWCSRGFWSKSALSDPPSATYRILTGEVAVEAHSQYSWIDRYLVAPKEYDLQYFPGQPHAYMDSYAQSVAAIGAGSKNPERSLMIYEKIATDERYFNLLHFGIEGKNYEFTENGELNPLDVTLFNPEACSFAWMTKWKAFERDLIGSPPSKAAVWSYVESIAAPNRYKMFSFNSEPVKNEFAAITNTIEEYAKPLQVGLVADPEAGLKTLNEQLYVAGLEKVWAEMQKQIDAYNAEYDS
ncbi:MAG: ABC transporter substrate-binding protein [Clostridiales bacterium]|jgi:putative aldouronate transport system substrate-binding protein|nr:ABC transporter substrate-binding protein [Clostridiales bacterium]